eukprot:3851983-Prymnesium_polylepis.1
MTPAASLATGSGTLPPILLEHGSAGSAASSSQAQSPLEGTAQQRRGSSPATSFKMLSPQREASNSEPSVGNNVLSATSTKLDGVAVQVAGAPGTAEAPAAAPDAPP